MCEVDGCTKPINKQGVCLRHKLLSVRANTHAIKAERNGTDVTGGVGTSTYVKDMYEKRRAAGMEDPIPENRKAARYAPAKGIFR